MMVGPFLLFFYCLWISLWITSAIDIKRVFSYNLENLRGKIMKPITFNVLTDSINSEGHAKQTRSFLETVTPASFAETELLIPSVGETVAFKDLGDDSYVVVEIFRRYDALCNVEIYVDLKTNHDRRWILEGSDQ